MLGTWVTAIIVGVVGAILCVLIVLLIKYTPVFKVHEQQAVIIERFGKFKRELGSGMHLMWPFGIEEKRKFNDGGKMVDFVDMRERLLDLPPQNVITKDNLQIEVDSIAYYQITNARSAMYHIDDAVGAVNQLIKTVLRDVIGTTTLEDLQGGREEMNEKLHEQVNKELNIVNEKGTDKTPQKNYEFTKRAFKKLATEPSETSFTLTEEAFSALANKSAETNFSLTEQSFSALAKKTSKASFTLPKWPSNAVKAKKIPDHILDQLKLIQNKVYSKKEFLQSVETQIKAGQERIRQEQTALFLKLAKTGIEQTTKFQFTEQFFNATEAKKIPHPILDELKRITMEYATQENFLKDVENKIGSARKKIEQEQINVYKSLLLECAKEIPQDILAQLEFVKGDWFPMEEDFLRAVEEKIGPEHTAMYKSLLLQSASNEKIPDETLDKLQQFDKKRYDAEKELIAVLKETIGPEQTEMYKQSFLKHTERTIKGKVGTESGDWGINIRSVELQSITPPSDYVAAMRMAKVAELVKKAAITEAEGKSQAIILEAQGKAKEIDAIQEAVKKGDPNGNPNTTFLNVKYLESLEKISNGQATKVFMPFPANPTGDNFFQQSLHMAAGMDAYKENDKGKTLTKSGEDEKTKKIRRVQRKLKKDALHVLRGEGIPEAVLTKLAPFKEEYKAGDRFWVEIKECLGSEQWAKYENSIRKCVVIQET